NGLITRYLLYNPAGEFILSPGKGYYHMERYYPSSFAWDGMDFAAWRGKILDKRIEFAMMPACTNTFEGKTSRSILSIYAYQPTSVSRTTCAKVIFYIDEQQLHALLQPLYDNGAAFVYVRGYDGKILTYMSGEEAPKALALPAVDGCASQTMTVDGQKMIVSYARSHALHWTIVAATPHAVFFGQASKLLIPIAIGMFVLLAVGVALTVSLLHYNRRPLQRMLENLSIRQDDPQSARQGLWQIVAAIHQLAHSREMLAEKLDMQKLYMRNALVYQLVNGEFSNAEDIGGLLAQTDLVVRGKAYRGLYVRLSADPKQRQLTAAVLVEVLAMHAPHLQFLTLRGSEQAVLLYCVQAGEGADDFRHVLRELHDQWKECSGLEVRFYVGAPYAELALVSRSFTEAQQLMERFDLPEEGVIHEGNPAQTAGLGMAYSQHDDQNLISWTNMGKIDEIEALLQHIRERNEECLQGSGMFRQLLFHRMVYTLVVASGDMPIPSSLYCKLENLCVQQFFEMVLEQYRILCQRAQETKRSASNHLIAHVMQYIDAQYDNPDMSLTHLAQQFNLTENYLSMFIKDRRASTFPPIWNSCASAARKNCCLLREIRWKKSR
ncbi:MAG: hypothetical protein RR482_03105, partial [Clostridia bacterium]